VAWYLRKSFGIGPRRINLSKGALPYSVGAKGARIGVKPSGETYVHGGRYGLYFRRTLGGGATFREEPDGSVTQTPAAARPARSRTNRYDRSCVPNVQRPPLLREAGHDAATVIEQHLGGQHDPDIAAVCRKEARAVVTLDTDFADIRTYPPEQYAGFAGSCTGRILRCSAAPAHPRTTLHCPRFVREHMPSRYEVRRVATEQNLISSALFGSRWRE